jgi:hypothetical protein
MPSLNIFVHQNDLCFVFQNQFCSENWARPIATVPVGSQSRPCQLLSEPRPLPAPLFAGCQRCVSTAPAPTRATCLPASTRSACSCRPMCSASCRPSSSRHRGKASLAFSSLQQPPSARPLCSASHHPPLLQALATTHHPRAPMSQAKPATEPLSSARMR